MKPLNLIALLLFIAGATWTLTRGDRAVRDIQNRYYSAIMPFLKSGSSLETKAREFMQETRHSRELETELAAIRPELDRLQLFEARTRELEQENSQLRHALDFKEATKFDVVAARVTRRNPATWWQTVEIDAGDKQGVGTELAVLSNQGLVGKIERVPPKSDRSTVLLLTDENCLVSARVEGSPEVGIVSGRRGSNQGSPILRLRYLSANASLRKGQRVFTTGRGGLFQANILIGSIESVEKGALDSEALVRPSVDFSDLGAVFVVLSADQ
ncbi:MAG: rod shape-determining protein MreC [Verrucomicrobiota bacterium]